MFVCMHACVHECTLLLCVSMQEEVASKEKKDDPFTRRKCMPTLVALVSATVTRPTATLLAVLNSVHCFLFTALLCIPCSLE